MSDIEIQNTVDFGNIVKFPTINAKTIATDNIGPIAMEKAKVHETPGYDQLLVDATKLDALSKYPCALDYGIYRNLELRYADKKIRGGTVMKTVFRLGNAHSTCQQCLYTFEIDTYGRGCVHDCVYCYAKAELTVHGSWNNPIPVPIDFNEVRKTFYTVFETQKPNKWRSILEQRIPLRIGSMSDSFMWMDKKYGVTKELLRLLKFYNYPYVVFTRSDLVANDEYISLLDPKLSSIQFSISSTNDDLIRKVEPGAASASKRLKAAQKLTENGFWTTIRINPLFPIYPDGYFTDANFSWDGPVPKFDFSSFDMIDEIATYNLKSVLAGFVRLSSFAINNIERATGTNLRQFYRRDNVLKSSRDFHYSDAEIRAYYSELKRRSQAHGIQFSTCYIGNGEGHFWKDQDLWSNKKDCCNIKDRVAAFKTDARQIPFEERLRFTNHKTTLPSSDRLHEELGLLDVQSPIIKSEKKDANPSRFEHPISDL